MSKMSYKIILTSLDSSSYLRVGLFLHACRFHFSLSTLYLMFYLGMEFPLVSFPTLVIEQLTARGT